MQDQGLAVEHITAHIQGQGLTMGDSGVGTGSGTHHIYRDSV